MGHQPRLGGLPVGYRQIQDNAHDYPKTDIREVKGGVAYHRPADGQHQHDSRYAQVAVLGEVHVVFHQGPKAHRRYHAVQHYARPAQHAVGHRLDDPDGFAEEADNEGDKRRYPQGSGVIVARGGQHGGVLAVSGVGRSTHQAREDRCKAVAQHGAVQARVLGEVLAHHSAVGVHVPHVLHAGDYGDGSYHADGSDVEAGQDEMGHLNPVIVGDDPGVHQGRRGYAGLCEDKGQHIAAHQGDDDGAHLHHATAAAGQHHRRQADHSRQDPRPDVCGHIVSFAEDGKGAAVGAVLGLDVVDGRGGQIQADKGYAHPPDHRGEELVNKPSAKEPDDKGQQEVKGSRRDNAPHGRGDLFIIGDPEALVAYDPAEGRDKGEGAAKEGRHTPAGAQVEDKGTAARAEQSHAHVQARQQGHQYGGAAHGKGVLEPQRQRLFRPQLLIFLRPGEQQAVELFK